jgi:phage tail-like protein
MALRALDTLSSDLTTAKVGLAMRFYVQIDGIDLGGWASCKGLKVNFKLAEIEEGGTNDHVFWLPDRITYEHVVLTRAMTSADSSRVQGWLSGYVDNQEGGTANITLGGPHAGDEVISWSLRSVRPFSWEGPTLSADATDLARETLTLAHEGFL